ncbi:MAG TPA: hypothetical protein DEB24_02025 [Coriobacteriia bacterium]|nr:hypothetical protein [Coriobacteriia bacterium]
MSEQGDAAGLVREIVLALVDDPEQVQVSCSEEGDATIVEIRVSPDDIGKVIGRQGRIIKSIRTLVRALSSYSDGSRIEVEVID